MKPQQFRLPGIALMGRQSGASITEFLLAAPIVAMIGLTTAQAGLIYHGKTTLNYATFEAARTGAVNHAQVAMMREELGVRLAPVQGGDGTMERAVQAMARSTIAVQDRLATRLEVINPTPAAFDDWGINSAEVHQRVIPNAHLRHRDHQVGSRSGLSLRDANLLKVKVTYGLDMKVPIVRDLIALAMIEVDPKNAHYYRRHQFPLTAVATVRMQSDAWENEILAATADPAGSSTPSGTLPVITPPDTENLVPVGDHSESQQNQEQGERQETQASSEDGVALGLECDGSSGGGGGEFGLGNEPIWIETADYEAAQCSAGNWAYEALASPAESSVNPISSSDCG